MCKRVVRSSFTLAVGVLLTQNALGWQAIEWSGADPNNWHALPNRTIEIYAAGTYMFYATTGGPNDPPAEINGITVPSTLAGRVEVRLVRAPGTGNTSACTDLGAVDLVKAAPGVLGECRIGNNAATLDSIRVDRMENYF